MINPKNIIKELVEIQTYSMRWAERNTPFRCDNLKIFEYIISGGATTFTYEEAASNLKLWCEKINCNKFNKRISNLNQSIKSNGLKSFYTGSLEEFKRFTEQEHQLNYYRLEITLEYLFSDFYTISEIYNKTGIKESTIKDACQTERLNNTKKIAKTWLVNLKEVRDLWELPEDLEKLSHEKQKIFQEYVSGLNENFRGCVVGFKYVPKKIKLPIDAIDKNLAIEIVSTNKKRTIVYRNNKGTISFF